MTTTPSAPDVQLVRDRANRVIRAYEGMLSIKTTELQAERDALKQVLSVALGRQHDLILANRRLRAERDDLLATVRELRGLSRLPSRAA